MLTIWVHSWRPHFIWAALFLKLHGENVNDGSLRFFSNWVNPLSRNCTFYWAINHLLGWRILTEFVVCYRVMLRKEKLEKEVLWYVQNWNAFLTNGPGNLWLTGLTMKCTCKIDSYLPMLLRVLAGNQTDMISEAELGRGNTLISKVTMGHMTFPNAQLNISERLKWQRHLALLLMEILF